MPGPLAVAALTAGASAGGNALGTFLTNRQSQKWSSKMYDKQYSDNIKFWEMENQYNSPTNQMQRLKEAGLNPAFMYAGQGSGAAGQAGSINSPTPIKPNFNAPDISGLQQLPGQMMQSSLIKGQVDLMEAQKVSTLVRAASDKFGLGVRTEAREHLVDAIRLQNAETKAKMGHQIAQTTKSIDSNQREALQSSKSLEEASQRILTIEMQRTKIPLERQKLQAAIANLTQDTKLKELEAKLRETGISFKDSIISRWIGMAISEIAKQSGASKKSFGSALWDILKKFF